MGLTDVKKFFKEDEIERYVDMELDEIADNFYSFAHGFFNLDRIEYPEKCLKNVIPDEYNREEGICKKYFNEIYELENNLMDIEKQARKDENVFFPGESMVEDVRTLYQALMRDFSKKMFLYGVKFGTRLARKI